MTWRRFARDNCPAYLGEKNFNALKGQKLIKNLNIVSGTFMSALTQRKYSKARALSGAPSLTSR